MGRKTKGYFVGDNQYHCEHCETTKEIDEFPKDKTKKLGFMSRCKVCFNNIPNILLKPCLHVAICNYCEESIGSRVSNKKCPICRKTYHTSTSIFIC